MPSHQRSWCSATRRCRVRQSLEPGQQQLRAPFGGGFGGFGGFGNNNQNSFRVGYTVGGGLEWMFAPNWSVKAEYLYVDLGRNNNNNNFFFRQQQRQPQHGACRPPRRELPLQLGHVRSGRRPLLIVSTILEEARPLCRAFFIGAWALQAPAGTGGSGFSRRPLARYDLCNHRRTASFG